MTAITAPTPQKRPLSSLMTAKTNFVASINHGIEALMQGSGHSRERATKTLLRELGRGGQAPTENEVRSRMIRTNYELFRLCMHSVGVYESAHELASWSSRLALADCRRFGLNALDLSEPGSTSELRRTSSKIIRSNKKLTMS
jgi:hypothetical protein